ncbi:PIN domain-like protein [Fennellomyces sp. T-0311]|nr:PIN domain-like protein [Fennellomyces sp. T-0311]
MCKMGSTDLLQLVKSVHQPMHIKEYAGKTVAVDGRAWHPSESSLATNESNDTFLDQLATIRSHDVTPLVVFDGKILPCDKKAKGNDDDDKDDEANKEAMFKRLEKLNVEYLTAPFEASAQLAYLVESKQVAAIVSDLVVSTTTIFGMNSDGSATRLCVSQLELAEEIELRDWSPKSIQELCLMCDCANVQVERAHSLFVKHKKNMRSALGEALENDHDRDIACARVAARWSQKVHDRNQRRQVPWHKDLALEAQNTNKTTTTPSDKKNVKTIRLHQDNKENIPPWMNRTVQEATSQAVHRDNPEPPQQAPKVADEIVPLAKKDNRKSESPLQPGASKASRPKLTDKKRKSLDGVDDENSPVRIPTNKKRGSQSLPLRKRFGLSDNSNRHHASF